VVSFIAENMAPIMFAALVGFLIIGYPAAFALAANGLIFFVIAVELAPFSGGEINLSWPLLRAMPERVFGIMNNETLLAIPFFTLMGLILERSGMAEDLLDTIGQLFGSVRGGIAYAVIFVGALLAATTGVVAASVIAMGLISLPIMLRYQYDRGLATGVIVASGTLAQIIPPSIVLIVMADQLGRSVGDMYQGALVPGLLLTLLMAGYVFFLTLFRPSAAPALPPETRTLGTGVTSLFVTLLGAIAIGVAVARFGFEDPGSANARVFGAVAAVAVAVAVATANEKLKLGLLSRLAERVIIVLVPPLALIFLVLGTIFIGLATPTEGGAMGAVGALVLAFAKRRLDFALLRQAVESTAKLSAFVLFILIGARVFSLTFYGVNGHLWVEHLLLSLPGGQFGFLVFVQIIVFLLGFFIDFFEIAFIALPLLAPAAEKLGIDMIWFGVLIAVNLQTSFLTPPFGFALFYLRSIAPKESYVDKVTGQTVPGIPTGQIYRGAVPFIAIQVVMVLIVLFVPQLVTHYKEGQIQLAPEKLQQELQNLTPAIELPPLDLGPPRIQ
jgi:TRAP-type mannitol/chloroaromatic compound transport system permease large subunit